MNPQKTKPNQPCKLAVRLLFAVLLTLTGTASAQLVISGSSQTGSVPFTPTWTPVTGHLLANVTPTTTVGNFTTAYGSPGTGAGVAILTTVGTSLEVRNYDNEGNVVLCGRDAGKLIGYTLPTSANGYNITNITVYGSWQDNGRDRQDYTVLYATADDPSDFKYLTNLRYNPPIAGGIGSASQVIINDASGAAIARNVVALRFDFTTPGAENNAGGYNAITVQGAAAANMITQAVLVATANQSGANPFTPSWTLETPNLVAGLAPTTASGNFADGVAGTSVLTDGAIGASGDGSGFASCGANDGNTLIYTLTNSVNGSDLTNIVVYSGWGDAGRFGQYYTLSYSTVSAPTAFIPITTVYYFPQGVSGAQACRVAIFNPTNGVLARNVQNVKFDFAPPFAGDFNNGWQGYSEIVVQGGVSAPPANGPSPYLVEDALPRYAETVAGDTVVFTAAYSNTPPASLQWQVVKAGVTNNVSGATSSTLTLNNVQVSDSGFYLLKATNSINVTAFPSYSTARQLVVSNTPTLVNNVVLNYAAQTFGGSTNFFPAWSVDTNHLNLTYGFTSGTGPGTFVSVGDFSLDQNQGTLLNGDASILSDGIVGPVTSLPNLKYVGGGNHTYGVGESVTYTLNPPPAGFGLEITNITVFGGWHNPDHNAQKYQVLYSTVSSPATFVPLLTADYAPGEPSSDPVVSRTTLVPVNGVMAHNVAALKFNFNLSPNVKNGWSGYSEILVGGKPATGLVPAFIDLSPSTAADVVGSQIILTASFSGATSLQWQKNGTNIVGATSSTLTLNNLQLTDGGSYALAAANANGTTFSSTCSVSVNTVPAATNNILTTIATQTSIAEVFTPTWDANVLSSSLINNISPSSSGDGDFSGGSFNVPPTPTGGSQPVVLTDGTFGTIDFNQTGLHAWVTCIGSGTGNNNSQGGNFVTYTLSASANGYNIAKIMTAGGWNDGGRDQQSYTVNYATVANPTFFIPLTVVRYNPVNPVGYSMSRATVTPVSGVLASNVVALQFDMTTPAGENGYSGYSEIAAYGSPSATPPPAGLVITTEHQEDSTSWTAETPNLIAGQLPSSQGPGVFTNEGCSVTNLTDGALGFGFAFGASCGNGGGAVPYIVFNSTNGWDLTNIVVYTLWSDYGRDGQFYDLSYSTWSAPTTFLPLASVRVNPPMPHDGRKSGLRVAIAPQVGHTLIASNVAAVKIDFTPQVATLDFGWSGYTEIVLQGSNLTLPVVPWLNPVTVFGGNLILTGTSSPNAGFTVLTATNLLTPLANWTVSVTGVTAGNGAFSNAIPVSVTHPASYFRVRVP